MKTIDEIKDAAIVQYGGRATFANIDAADLAENIRDIVAFAALATAQAIKDTTLEKSIEVLNTEGKDEHYLQSFFDDRLKHNDIVSIDQVGKHLFAISLVKHVPDLV